MPGAAVHQKRKTQHSMENVEKISRYKKERYKTGKLKDARLRERRGESQGWSARG